MPRWVEREPRRGPKAPRVPVEASASRRQQLVALLESRPMDYDELREAQREGLVKMGARDVVAEEVEGAVEVIARLLRTIEVPRNVIDETIATIRAETQIRVQEALNSMDPLDREVLTLRHFEMLSNEETARVLDISKSAASNRYIRALKRLKETLDLLPGRDDDQSGA